jgi:pimeloyl-ACP methyl ester carboxylesterase
VATPTLSTHTIPGVLGPILIDVRTSDRTTARPAVLIVHGFKGFKDWGMFPILAERLARSGFSAVSFNLSGSGVDQAGEFSHPQRFGHNTWSIELQDITRVMDALSEGRLGLAATTRFGFVGHSLGGGAGILLASRDPRIRALVTWAAVSRPQRWPTQVEEWRARGELEIVNSRTGQVLPMYIDRLEDIEENPDLLDISAAAERVTIPWLLLHGTGDTSVPVEEGEALAAAAPPQTTRAMFFDGANHTFGAVHPFAGMNIDLAQALDETVKWLGRHL